MTETPETPEAKVVREMQDAASRRDSERLRQYFHPDVELIVPSTRPEPGVYRGHQEFFRWMSWWYQELFDSFQVELLGLSQFDEIIVAEYRIHGTGRLSGVEVTEVNASVFTVRDGLIVRVYAAGTVEEGLEVAKREAAAST